MEMDLSLKIHSVLVWHKIWRLNVGRSPHKTRVCLPT